MTVGNKFDNTLALLLSQSAHLLHPDAAEPLPPNDHHDKHAAITATLDMHPYPPPSNIHSKRQKISHIMIHPNDKDFYGLPIPDDSYIYIIT